MPFLFLTGLQPLDQAGQGNTNGNAKHQNKPESGSVGLAFNPGIKNDVQSGSHQYRRKHSEYTSSLSHVVEYLFSTLDR